MPEGKGYGKSGARVQKGKPSFQRRGFGKNILHFKNQKSIQKFFDNRAKKQNSALDRKTAASSNPVSKAFNTVVGGVRKSVNERQGAVDGMKVVDNMRKTFPTLKSKFKGFSLFKNAFKAIGSAQKLGAKK